ncbi:uncharacterized protein (UPF0303 family) [Homoserinimonas aerilata]|uniref:UPF0303 protein FB562_1198 n=1 Tax=Homoserinimonas aerilata TaxID=1162970 RepID=A0A542YJ39_9MICO|nr:heme-degrading domain-containing protein [Homoserinimonas aerilata]TQL48116.1 uncharacterized protein (UPF0303 family) [Homoserinimonas aerilata]
MDDLRSLIAEVVAQEERLTLTRFDNDDAWRLGSILVELARQRKLPVTLDITRNGQQLFRAVLPGAIADQSDWIARKNRTVTRFEVSSYLVGLRFAASGRSFDDEPHLDSALYAAHGGAFPIRIANVGVVGTVTVSGLPQADDHALAVEALEQLHAQQQKG